MVEGLYPRAKVMSNDYILVKSLYELVRTGVLPSNYWELYRLPPQINLTQPALGRKRVIYSLKTATIVS